MELYVKQQPFSFNDKLTITDEQGVVKYCVKGNTLALNRKLTIFGTDDRPLAEIKERMLTVSSKFDIIEQGQIIATISEKLKLTKQFYQIEGTSMSISGDILGMHFVINDGDSPLATISKTTLALGAAYKIKIDNPQNELTILAIVLAIYCVNSAGIYGG